MKTNRWSRGVLLAGALALGLAAGCGGDDDGEEPTAAAEEAADDGEDGSVEADVVATTNGDGTVSFVTNLVFIPNPITTIPLKLPAPKLIGPANGVSWDLAPGAQGATVKFEWQAVSGADSYSLAVKRPGADFKTTSVDASPTWAQHPRGTNFWKVAAVKGDTPQTWSETRSFIFK